MAMSPGAVSRSVRSWVRVLSIRKDGSMTPSAASAVIRSLS